MRKGTRRAWPTIVAALTIFVGLPLGSPGPVAAVSPNVVISQVYGGGGNTGATYTHDYIELFNRGTTTAGLAGWSLQYASATGTGNFGANSGQLTELPDVLLAPGQYYLVQEASTAAVGSPLPTPDTVDATPIAMAAGSGKVALVSDQASLGCNGSVGQPCTPAALARIIDLVGYGTANFFEGSGAAPTLTNTTSAFRASGGCTDTDNNATDFSAATPAARNTATATHSCDADSAPFVSATTPSGAATGVGVGSNVTISLNEPVNVTGTWYSISCTSSGAHTAVVSGGPSTFTLNPDADFNELEMCTVTVFAANVTDQDVNDPPDNMAADYTFSFQTEGDICSQPFTHAYQIQGSGLSAAITGSVTTQGIVVGDFEGTAAVSGFYLQDAAGDADAGTSDGIFVFTGSADTVSVGDVVRVSGFARERFNQTALNGSNSNSSAVTQIVDCGTAALPNATDVTLPFASPDFPERYEGMLVRLPQSLVIAEYFNYDRFGEIVLAKPLAGDDRPFTPTAVEEPGPDAVARALANSLSRITLDDVQSAQNPAVLRHPNGDPFSLTNRFRGGDLVADTIGVLGYDFNLYRIFPTGPADYTALNPRPAAPSPVGGELTVAAMNTLNFFLTLDLGPDICGPFATLECRGADDSTEFGRQRAKLIAALIGLDADVIGLNELENTNGVEPLADIVAGLNDALGAGTYAYIDTGTIGTDAIKVGLIYRPAAVTPVGDFAILDSSVDGRFIDTKNRPTLAQTFAQNSSGEVFTIAVNHLKSKGSDCNDVGDPDTGDGQGNCAVTREQAAQALVDWLATDPTGSGDADYLIVGDLNSYAMEDSIDAVKAGPDDVAGTGDDYTNLIAKYVGEDAYSYLFDAQFGYLDHALASASMVGQVTGATEWHINADEPDVLDYDTTFKPPAQDALYQPNAYRSSDHDPVVVGLDLAASSGLVTGGGRFAGGAFTIDTTDTSHFTLPDGSELVSTGYDWLTVSGNDASLQGEATLDGVSGYSFRVVVHDGGSPARNDRLRLVVWDPDGDLVYDSQPGDVLTAAPTTPLKSGNVSVHK